MNRSIRIGMIPLVLLISELFSSCTSSRLSNVWRDHTFTSGPLTNILVITVSRNAAHRRIWEDGFANAIGEHGVSVTPSYRLFPDDLPDTSVIVDTVRAKGFDGVLVVTKLATQSTTNQVQGYEIDSAVYRLDQWDKGYRVHYEKEYHEGYTDSSKIFRHQISIWTPNGGMIWTGMGEVVDPNSSTDVNEQIVNLIVPELGTDGIIPPKE